MKAIQLALFSICITFAVSAQIIKVGTSFKLNLPPNSRSLTLDEYKNFFSTGSENNEVPILKSNFRDIHKWQAFSVANVLMQVWENQAPYRTTTLEQQQKEFKIVFAKKFRDSKIVTTAFSKFLIFDYISGDIIHSTIYSSIVNGKVLCISFEYKPKDEALAKTYQTALLNTIGPL